ncbi:Uma2 family endonuclease [Spirosoma soli]|uniref:Uma2 family endonuclease n=1 Tax=Spirosoma soli TaxID=1770529 RepID=A0ABW5M1Z5_9BACT
MITDISQLDPKGTYTYADYLKWQFDESVELIKGKIYWMSPAPKRMHQSASGNLSYIIRQHLDGKKCQVYDAPFDVRLPVQNKKKPEQIYTVVQPDISVICDPAKLDDDGCLGAPDWIIEITSPRTAKKDFDEKFHLYEQSGVREYWIVQPKEKAINVYTLENEEYALVDIYESEEIPCRIFPDLIVAHSRVFA